MNCKNCGEIVEGQFCSHCGQSIKVSEINFTNFLNEVTQSVFLVNKGFFYTLIKLFKSPGQSIADFLAGKRKYYFKPITYLLVLSTLYFLISRFAETNTLIYNFITGFFLNDSINEGEIPSSLTWFTTNYAYSSLILVPFFSLASFLAFIGYKRNYLEHIVLNAYVTGQQAVIYSIFILLDILVESDFLEGISVIVSVSYVFWVFWQFFKGGNRILNVFRSILTYIIYLLAAIILLVSLA